MSIKLWVWNYECEYYYYQILDIDTIFSSIEFFKSCYQMDKQIQDHRSGDNTE